MLIDGSLLNEFIPTFKNEKTWATGSFQFIVKKKKSFTCIGIGGACYRYEAPVSSMNELGPWLHLNSLIRSLYRMIGISPPVHFTW